MWKLPLNSLWERPIPITSSRHFRQKIYPLCRVIHFFSEFPACYRVLLCALPCTLLLTARNALALSATLTTNKRLINLTEVKIAGYQNLTGCASKQVNHIGTRLFNQTLQKLDTGKERQKRALLIVRVFFVILQLERFNQPFAYQLCFERQIFLCQTRCGWLLVHNLTLHIVTGQKENRFLVDVDLSSAPWDLKSIILWQLHDIW